MSFLDNLWEGYGFCVWGIFPIHKEFNISFWSGDGGIGQCLEFES